jgi:hypothetical protein
MRALTRLTVREDLHLTGPEFLTADVPPLRHRRHRPGPPDRRPRRRAADDRLARPRARPPAIDAYLLCSVAVDVRISEIVDVPNYIVTAHCPLSIFD